MMTASTLAPAGLLYPFTLGLVAAVNPCGFPLLPVYLGLFVEGDGDERSPMITRVRRALEAGMFATAGFVVLFGTLGIITEAGLSGTYAATASWARFVMAPAGVLLFVVGLTALFGRTLHLPLPEIRPGLGLRRPLAIGVFGFSYGVASLGCSLPLFLAGVAGSFTRSGTVHGIATFLAYAVGMGLLLTVLALVIAVSGPTVAHRLRFLSPLVRPIGAVVLIAVGAYLALYWINDIVDPTGTFGVLRFVDSVQADVATFVSTHATVLGTVLAVLACGGFAFLAFFGGDRRAPRSGPA